MKILIAEDDNMQRKFLTALLNKADHEVIPAISGKQAWETMQDEQIRMLITDWMMPDMNGLDLIQNIRAADWPSYTYILLLTSKDSKTNTVEGLQAGADDYLTKPFDRNELMARVGIGERILNLEARLAHMATHDTLTGLLNRRALYDIAQARLESLLEDQDEISFIMLDVDYFKNINDNFGHMIGDRALCQIADTINRISQDSGFVGRWGGEEFLIALPGMNLEQTVQMAKHLCVDIADTPLLMPDGKQCKITISLGVSSTSAEDPPYKLDTLIDLADQAMYRAKTGGRNRACT
jgi:two-component system, cell cycle response regulator